MTPGLLECAIGGAGLGFLWTALRYSDVRAGIMAAVLLFAAAVLHIDAVHAARGLYAAPVEP